MNASTRITLANQQPLEVANPAKNLLFIPLSLLLARRSKRNVRKSPRLSIPELAASILRVGLLQNLVVILAADGEHYEVVAGDRRLSAFKLLAKGKRISADHEIPCLLVADASARTVSLTENVLREAMHPADQFQAFAALVAEGRPVEDIAADFGVTPLVVQRRLKLANVSPRLMADYRNGEVTLDQLMALAITDDHTAQEAAFYDVLHWQRNPQALRQHLTETEIDSSRDPLARFVGVAAYEAAGGALHRDLFADSDHAYLNDAPLLERLAREKLEPMANILLDEGWSWVQVIPRTTPADLMAFQRAPRERRQPTAKEAKRLALLQKQWQRLVTDIEKLENDDTEDNTETLEDYYARRDAIEKDQQAVEQSLLIYGREVYAMAGAILSVDAQGNTIMHRGLLNERDAKAFKAAQHTEADGEEEAPKAKSGISERLARSLSAHRTAALQIELARQPSIALVALLHRLALSLFYGETAQTTQSTVRVNATAQDHLERFAPEVPNTDASQALEMLRQEWRERLPDSKDQLFASLLDVPQPELLSLLALCVASTVDAISAREDDRSGVALAAALHLDMGNWFAPTADNYFAHVPKGKIIEAVKNFAPKETARLEKLKKGDMATEAARLVEGTKWLPVMLTA